MGAWTVTLALPMSQIEVTYVGERGEAGRGWGSRGVLPAADQEVYQTGGTPPWPIPTQRPSAACHTEGLWGGMP